MPEKEDEIERLREENDRLEHAIVEQKLMGIKGQVQSLGDTVHQRITESEARNDIEFTHIREGIDQILKLSEETLSQSKKTNGRVTELEKQKIKTDLEKEASDKKIENVSKNTRAVRFMHKYPIVTTGFVLVGYLFSIQEIRQHTIEGMQRFFSLFGKIF